MSEKITIKRREAKSRNISYAEPVVLHESSQQRIVLTPFFIPRSEGTQLSVKITTYAKQKPPLQDMVREEKCLSLNETAARKLSKCLKEHFVVSEEDSDGDYLVLKISEGTAKLGQHDPAEVTSALLNVLGSEEIVQHLAGMELSQELVTAFHSAMRLSEMKNAVALLRENLDAGKTLEQLYQSWCERHTWAFGNAYVMRDEVRGISPGDSLDLLLPNVISGFRDIVELKRPDMTVINYDASHRNYYFSAEVSKTIGQCHRYLDVLHEVAANGLRDHPEVVAYHPRAIIVIGRSNEWNHEQLKVLHGLNRRLSGISVMTYDQLLSQGERLIEMFSTFTPEDDEDDQGLRMYLLLRSEPLE